MNKPRPSIQQSPFRRIVTARDNDTRSKVQIDGAARNLGTLHEFWMTDDGVPPLELGLQDPIQRPFQISPGRGGSVFRFVEILPEKNSAHLDEEQRREAVRSAFAAVGAEQALVNTKRHPAMHQTETIDYIILLQGELTMLLDDGEVDLKPFDVVIQRGTNHAWINKGDEMALLAAVLISTD